MGRLKFLLSVNWLKTIYFNFKMFPFKIAKKLPVFFYGSVKFSDLSGKVSIDGEIKTAMIGFGQSYEMATRSRKTAEIYLSGHLCFKGHVQFGKDYFIYINGDAYCEMGHMSSMAALAKLICTNNIVFGDWARIGSESQVIDTNFHDMKNTVTNEIYSKTAPIVLGNYNYIGNRVSIMSKTQTPNFCTIASNSLCNKNYTALGENILIGGMPSKLLKSSISRDWEGERLGMERALNVKVF